MLLIIVFIAGFGYGYFRALRMGGGLADRLRYATVYGVVFALAVFMAERLASWWGLLS